MAGVRSGAAARTTGATVGRDAGAAVFGEAQYRIARFRDVTPAYNRVAAEQRFLPPLVMPKEQIDEMLEILKKCI